MVPPAEHQRPCPCQSVARPRFTSAAAVPQFQASHHIPRPALLTCSVHLGRHRHEEWGPQTSGSVTNTKHILSSSLEQSANLESSAPPQAIESKLPSPRFSCQMHAHLRLPSPSADTSLGLSGTKLYLNRPSLTAALRPLSHVLCCVRSCTVCVPHLNLLGDGGWGRGLGRPTKDEEGTGPGEASSRRSLFATE